MRFSKPIASGDNDNRSDFEILNLVSLLMEGQTLGAIDKLNLLYDGGADPLLILRDLIHIVHYLTLFKVDAAESLRLSHTDAEFKALEELASKLQVGTLSMVWQMLHKGLQEVSDTFSPISALEMLLIRIAYTADIPKPNELIEEISKTIEDYISHFEGRIMLYDFRYFEILWAYGVHIKLFSVAS